jgi:predicted amidohydrolase
MTSGAPFSLIHHATILMDAFFFRFPELHIILRRKGADIITIPSSFTLPTGRAHWHTLVRSVAINYQVYVIAAAQAGAHSPQRSSWGEALVFDPWGVELGRLPSVDEADDPTQPMPPQFILADVDPARVECVFSPFALLDGAD